MIIPHGDLHRPQPIGVLNAKFNCIYWSALRKTMILWQFACVVSSMRRNHRKPLASMKGVITTKRRNAVSAKSEKAADVVRKPPRRLTSTPIPFRGGWEGVA